MFDSDGNCISVLEKALDEKHEKRSCFKKYLSCCFDKKSKTCIPCDKKESESLSSSNT